MRSLSSLAPLMLLAATITAAPAPGNEVKDLLLQGVLATRNRDFAKAVTLYERVTLLAPKDLTVWNNLGWAYQQLKEYGKAENAFRTAIALNPRDTVPRNNLGQILWAQKKLAEAEAAFREEGVANPEDPYGHQNLGAMLLELERYQDALPELEKANALLPSSEHIPRLLGVACLHTGQEARGLQILEQVVNAFPSPLNLNDVAYAMAVQNLALDRAQAYAQEAVGSMEALLRGRKLGALDSEQEADTRALGSYWDTLGWVYFQQGDLVKAQSFLVPAWQLNPGGETAEHLGELYLRQGDKARATDCFARALAAEPPAKAARTHLLDLLGSEAALEAMLHSHGTPEGPGWSLTLSAKGLPGGTVACRLALGPGGRIVEAKVLDRPEAWPGLGGLLGQAVHTLPFPAGSSTRLVLDAVATSRPDSGTVTLRFLEAGVLGAKPKANQPAGASADSFRLSAGALAKWAGPEVLALGVTTARVQAFLEARRQALEAGNQDPFATWLQRLSAAKSPSLRAWALARRLEAGEAKLLPAYQDLLALHLQGPSPANPDTEIQEPPQGMPGTVTFEPSPAQWNAFLDRARASMEAPMPMSTYAFWCYRTQASQRSLVLEEAGKVALRSSFFDLTGDPWSDLRFCLVMDWAMAWGNEEDFRDLEQTLPEGAPRDECVWIHEQLRTLKGYFVAVGTTTINLGTPAPPGLRPSPSSRVVDFSFSQMKIKAQPPAPAYPLEAKRHRRMATVKVQITVGPNGLPLRTQVLPGPWLALLGPVGCRYAMDWTFEPALLNGVPQTARFLLTMPFRLK